MIRTIAFFLFCTAAAYPCTGIKLVADDGSIVHGRTAEFGIDLDISLIHIPRGYEFTGTTPQGPGLTYQAKYAAVGAIAFDVPIALDGLNEKGLSVGIFYFPGYAEYGTITRQNQANALSPLDFSNWLLTQFASVDEVKIGLKNIVIAPTVSDGWGNEPPAFHYIVIDRQGRSLVIEPIGGKLVTYDNKLGVMSNSPAFDWHMTNLKNYIHLSPFNAAPLKIDGIDFVPFGQGSGMTGLPGDFSPPSRFVRAAIFCVTATPSKTASQAVLQAFHILNQFDIPVGVVRAKDNGVVHTDQTLATVVRDPQALKYYFKTYKNQTIKMVDLTTLNPLDKMLKHLDISDNQTVSNISKDFKY